MIELIDSVLTFRRNGRAVVIQRLTDANYYTALRAFNVSDVQAQAVVVKLITLKVGN